MLIRHKLPVLAAFASAGVMAQEGPTQEADALHTRIEELNARVESLEQASQDGGSGAERVSSEEQDDTLVNIGGALRFNLIYREFDDASVGKRGEGGLDVFRFNIDGRHENWLFSVEYRFYPYMNTIQHGWIGYRFEDSSELQLGVTQVPFGLLPYASHNSWFGVPYYVGLADDNDMGVKYLRSAGAWDFQLAFFKNEELNDATNPDRYSYDLIRDGDQQNEEANQFNAWAAYTFGKDTGCETEAGVSAEAGEVYNTQTQNRGGHWAAAAHADSRCGRWNFQLEAAHYHYDPKNPAGVDSSVVQMGAFAGHYEVAGEGTLLVANVAYSVPSPWRGVESITCYNDYSRLNKGSGFQFDSQINTTGCALGSGPLFTYVDYILANNVPYFGVGSLGHAGEEHWHGRLNINIGYYF